MSAPTRSQHRPPIYQTDDRRKAPSRIPTNSGRVEQPSSKSTQHVSRLAGRRTSSSIPSSDNAGRQREGDTTTAPDPVTAMRHGANVPRAALVSPHSATTSASQHRVRSNHATVIQPPTIRTPSLVSGSSVQTPDSPRSHGLRRKPSTIDSYTSQMRARGPRVEADRETMHSRAGRYDNDLDDVVLGMTLPPTGKHAHRDLYQASAPASALPRLDTQHSYQFRDVTPPVPGLSHSATPSTRYSDSPYSHVPTPSSASSYSSGLPTTSTSNPKHTSNSPLRIRCGSGIKPASSSTQKSLPPVRESSTSSSNSTVKAKQTKQGASAPATAASMRPGEPLAYRRGSATYQKASIPPQKEKAIHIPPELAHLNVDTPQKPTTRTTLHPRRPSRDRTPSLTNVNDPSPVVHSDLPRLYTTYHKRTPSQDTNGSATSTSFRSRLGFSPKTSSKQNSPRVDSAFSPSPASKRSTRLPTPDTAAYDGPQLLRKDSPAIAQPPSPAPSKSPRFSFLSRKSKSSTGEKTAEKPKREAKKGPVAGTGHEKYGRFGFRGRSSSATGSQTFSRSPSADSSASGAQQSSFGRKWRKGSTTSDDASDMDDFLKDRLTPIVLRGSGNTFGSKTEIWAGKDDESSSSPSADDAPRPQLLPSAMAIDHDTSPVRDARKGMPPNVNMPSDLSSSFSYDAEGPTEPRSNSVSPPEESHEGKEGLWLRPLKKEQAIPKLKHKWNFFQRAQSSQHKENTESTSGEAPTGMHMQNRLYEDAVHLGIFDAVEPVELAEVGRIIQEHDASTARFSGASKRSSRVASSGSGRSNPWPSPAKVPSHDSDGVEAKRLSPSVMAGQILTESPELFQARAVVPQQPRQVFRTLQDSQDDPISNGLPGQPQSIATPELMHETNDTPETPRSVEITRQSRLSPIGRIPMVVSKRDRDRRLPDNSFSRPFASTQPRPTVRPPGSLYNQIRDLASPTDSGSQPVSSTSGRSDSMSGANQSSINVDQPSASTNRSSMDFYAGNDFIVFAPRKESALTYSSGSDNSNWMSSLPPHVLHDDIWNEYNDLMDDVMPEQTPISAGSSLGAPFQYASMLQDNHSPSMPAPLNYERSSSQPVTTTLPIPPSTRNGGALLVPGSQDRLSTQPPVSPMALDERNAIAFAASQNDDRFTSRPVSPLTPDTLAQFVGTYGDRSATSSVVQNRPSVPQPFQHSLLTPRGSISSRHSRVSRHSRSASLPEANARNSQMSLAPGARFNRDTLLDIPEHDADKNPTTPNLRFGALMTSKWLSFGRVLFSPAHNEVRLADEARILVVDGLGDDWSHYVATTYPNAVVYNLSVPPTNASESSGWGPLPNYRHFNHGSLTSPFPFPKGFFAAVVFRFPVAATEHAYQACILESKRVLRPGGHLEVVALDIDMMNMGTRGRRALRGLKTRMQQSDQDVSLCNLSDTLVRMIGRRGFEEVQRCVVGVPAAGRIPRSDSSCSTSTSGRPRRSDSNSSAEQQDKGISFAALLQNNRQSQIVEPGRANDEGITKMVARVGRWWYSACYEQALLETDKSVWQEPGLLRECEKQGTSFRLLICCAQKPLQTRRRTKSV